MYSVLSSLDENIKFRLKLVILLSFFTIIFDSLSIISIFPVIKTFINPGYLDENINFLDLSNLSSKQINIIVFSILLLIFIFKNIFIYLINIIQSKIVNFAIYIEEPTDSQFWAADINEDGMINILDIVQVVNMILDN